MPRASQWRHGVAWILAVISALAGTATPRTAAGESGTFLGVVFARQAVDVAPMMAATVRDIRVRLGDTVAQNQVLLLLESSELDQEIAAGQAALRSARADSMRAAADLTEVTKQHERREKAVEAFSVEEMEALTAKESGAQANLESARALIDQRLEELRALEQRKRSLTLRAPFAGRVTSCTANLGEFVAANRPLVRLASTSKLWVRFAVPVDASSQITPGRIVRVQVAGSSTPIRAEIRQVSPEVDSVSGMIIAEAIILDRGALGDRLPVGSVVRIAAAP